MVNKLNSTLNQNQLSIRGDKISVQTKIAITLKYLSTGDNYSSLEQYFFVKSCTISKIVVEVCKSIIKILGPIFLTAPKLTQDWLEISRQFRVNFGYDHCLGAIDGKHVRKYQFKFIYFKLIYF